MREISPAVTRPCTRASHLETKSAEDTRTRRRALPKYAYTHLGAGGGTLIVTRAGANPAGIGRSRVVDGTGSQARAWSPPGIRPLADPRIGSEPG